VLGHALQASGRCFQKVCARFGALLSLGALRRSAQGAGADTLHMRPPTPVTSSDRSYTSAVRTVRSSTRVPRAALYITLLL